VFVLVISVQASWEFRKNKKNFQQTANFVALDSIVNLLFRFELQPRLKLRHVLPLTREKHALAGPGHALNGTE
jgi:hypothetical protein